MIELKRTTSTDKDFQHLIEQLDNDLLERNGNLQAQYNAHNIIDPIKTVIIAYFENEAIGCGCFKEFNKETVEVKRMYVKPSHRGKGLAAKILQELELWAKELNYKWTILETGKNHIEAQRLYHKANYIKTSKYGPYIGNENSICMRKELQ